VKLALIRHGPTEWNAQGRFQGRSDVPLSEQGRRDARSISTALRGDDVGVVYSSDLSRALETAEIIAVECGAPIFIDERLREFDFGRWEGLTWPQIVASQGALKGHAPTAARHYQPEGGESFADVRARIHSFLASLQKQPDDGTSVIVTHAGVLHAFLAALQLDDSVTFTPGSITRVTLADGAAQVKALNDVRHLQRAV
jgi:broad specificity phosphatase PhoE